MARLPSAHWYRTLGPRTVAAVRSLRKQPGTVDSFEQHAISTVAWLIHAHSQNQDGGVSAFYDLLRDRWAPSYPETTGYIVPTLLAYSSRQADAKARRAGLEMSEYLLRMQTPEGAIRGWAAGDPVYVFDTGQVLFGWLAALQETGESKYPQALHRSANWLSGLQEPEGYWTRYQFGGHIKVWDARVAWALILVGQALGQNRHIEAGRRCIEWALTQQQSDGWFEHCSLEPGEPPVTHTIAYTIEALLESGDRLGEERYIRAARQAADALLERRRADGSLSAYWSPGWQPLSRSSCLTGNAQMALCWLRLYELTGQSTYLAAGADSLRFVASTQSSNGGWPPIQGAIAGSWPIWGSYLQWCYPNWAAKFFLDALMRHSKIVERTVTTQRPGKGLESHTQ